MGVLRGQFFGDVSGKVGGEVFSRSLKSKKLQVYKYFNQVGSSAQLKQRASFSDAVLAWKALLTPERQAWAAYSCQYGYTGKTYQFFIKCYLNNQDPSGMFININILRRFITVPEIISLSAGNLSLIGPPGVGKILVPRSFQCEILNGHYSFSPLNIVYSNGFQLLSISVDSSYFGVIFPSGAQADLSFYEANPGNLGISLSSGENVITDRGGSSGISIRYEYSIIDWPF